MTRPANPAKIRAVLLVLAVHQATVHFREVRPWAIGRI